MISADDIHKASILIVDEEDTDGSGLEQILRAADYISVASTSEPHTVCELHRQNHYDLILLDLHLPGLDGFEVMESLKEIETGGYLPVLVITAQPGHKLRALKAGAKDFVSKPFDLAEVLMRVHNLLEVRLLHQNETRLNRSRLENSQRIAGLGDWQYDFSDRRLAWSDEVYRILGISRQDSPPDSEVFYRQVHPDDLVRVHREKKAAAAGLRRVDFEHRIIRPSGEVRYIHQLTEMILDDDGKPAHESGTLQDITERKLAEETLRQSEERYRKMLLLSPDAHFVHVDGLITFANRTFCELMGAGDADQLLGRSVMEIAHPDHHELMLEQRRQISDDQPVASVEMKFIRLDGAGVEVEVASVAFDFLGRREVQMIARNITGRKQAEKALRTSEKRFKALFEQAAVGVALTEAATGRFVQVNQRFCQIAGRTQQEIAELNFTVITHPEDLARDVEIMRQLRAGTIRESTWEKRYLRADQSEVWVNLTVSAMWAPGDAPDLCIAVVQDITERKQLEEQFRQTQKMEAIGTLAGGIAHDFNNILTAIVGYTELSRMSLGADSAAHGHLGAVLRAAGRAADLVRQILTFSRQQPLERRAIQLRPVVAESVELLRAAIPSTIEFDVSLATDAPVVLADASQVHQILMNLGTNAWHAMKDHTGRLQVKLERCAVDAAHAAMQSRLQPGLYARVSVSDTGCGMSAATLRRIFEPFFTTKPLGEGTGLGLAVVHGIMDNHDGVVTVYSQPGEGTVFHFYFPAHAGEEVRAVVPEGPVARGNGERILFVDDEELLAQLGRKTLTALGYEVEIANSPTTALAMVRADPKRFALVLTDQTMPGMTGLLLANELRQIRSGLPIILMTGYSLSLTPERIEAAGIRQLLLKPTNVRSLGFAVHSTLSVQAPS